MTAAHTMAHKIAFARMFPKAPVGDSVAQMLENAFPEYQVDTFDVTALLKGSPGLVAANGVAMMRAYGRDILRGYRTIGQAFWGTSYLMAHARRVLAQKMRQQDGAYAFSFQLQSMLALQTDLCPHFVYTDHTHLANLDYTHFDRNRLNNEAWVAEERQLYHQAALVFTRSSNISRSLVDQYGLAAERAVCVYVGVNVRPQQAALPVGAKNGRYQEPHILFVGIDWERKGGPDLVQAFMELQKSKPNARLTIVGAAPDLNVPNCQVLGPVPVNEVSQYYQQASIFCLPTQLEPFGVAFVEAMAHRLPIVATNVGAIPDFVKTGYNGYLVSPNNVPELTAALKTLSENPEACETFGAQGYELFAQRYNWDYVGAAVRGHVLAAIANLQAN
ncbi:MAG: glycosyltransferase family 4 protein [Chloroflexi bacterium]|nr:glycosyltransferase family 4 protein [Chloroflexota bacterium]MBP7042973.1 glycosyltransferase family 4 protein [Chloroflexota bacterium]